MTTATMNNTKEVYDLGVSNEELDRLLAAMADLDTTNRRTSPTVPAPFVMPAAA